MVAPVGSSLISDPTDDPTHGAQRLTFFNAQYDTSFTVPSDGGGCPPLPPKPARSPERNTLVSDRKGGSAAPQQP